MGKTTVELRKNKYMILNKITYPEAINERELYAIAGGLMASLIPVEAETGKKGTTLKTTIEEMMPLHSYFTAIVTKKMFLDIIVQIVAVVKECEKNLMNVNNLMLDWDYIFLDPRTKQLKCIFWPIVNNQHPCSVTEFFKEIPFRVVFSKHESHDYMASYLRYFKNQSPFSINSFEKMIFEWMGKQVENRGHFPSGSTGYAENPPAPSKKEEPKSNSGRIAYNPFGQNEGAAPATKVCSTCGHPSGEDAKFCVSCGSPLGKPVLPLKAATVETIPAVKANTESFSETTVLSPEDNNGTTVLGADVYEEPAFPYLIREKTEEKISIDKPVFRIGKESRYCDYFVSNNNAVSRSHADLVSKNGRYYIVDNNSTNKTYVDGRAIPVLKEVEIFSGTKLRLANEEFVFYI